MTNRIITILAATATAVVLSGCIVREQPYTAGYSQSTSYPLYYADGAYWAYSDASWYLWANDHWTMSSYAPHRAVLVGPTYSHGYRGGSHYGVPYRGATHGISHGGGGHHGRH